MLRTLKAAGPLALLLLCACQSASRTSEPRFEGEIDYAAARPRDSDQQRQASLLADCTVIDLDDTEAASRLQRQSVNDIQPRVFRDAVGEWWAALALAQEKGDVAGRFTLAPVAGKAVEFSALREHYYLQDWKDNTPLVRSFRHGVTGKLTVSPQADGSFNIQVETTSDQMLWPVQTFLDGHGVTYRRIAIPEVARQNRLAAQAVKPGETAVFQLGRAGWDKGFRTRLLCVRLEAK